MSRSARFTYQAKSGREVVISTTTTTTTVWRNLNPRRRLAHALAQTRQGARHRGRDLARFAPFHQLWIRWIGFWIGFGSVFADPIVNFTFDIFPTMTLFMVHGNLQQWLGKSAPGFLVQFNWLTSGNYRALKRILSAPSPPLVDDHSHLSQQHSQWRSVTPPLVGNQSSDFVKQQPNPSCANNPPPLLSGF